MDATWFAEATPIGWYLLPPADERSARAAVAALDDVPFGPWALRTADSGKRDVIQRFCPHMGADLVTAGEFSGGSLRCMFHGRSIGLDGTCGHRGEGLTLRLAEVRDHPLTNPSERRRGAVFAAPPSVVPWEPLDFGEPVDSRPAVEIRSVSEVPIAPQLMLEGECDADHFLPVHGVAATEMRFVPDGTSAVLTYRFEAIETTAQITFDGLTRFRHVLRSPARTVDYVCWITRLGSKQSRIEGTLKVHADSRSLARREFVALARGFQLGVDQDRRIWNSRDSNVIQLTDRDGNVRAFRDWASGLLHLDKTATA